jgi:hypothetical protein
LASLICWHGMSVRAPWRSSLRTAIWSSDRSPECVDTDYDRTSRPPPTSSMENPSPFHTHTQTHKHTNTHFPDVVDVAGHGPKNRFLLRIYHIGVLQLPRRGRCQCHLLACVGAYPCRILSKDSGCRREMCKHTKFCLKKDDGFSNGCVLH